MATNATRKSDELSVDITSTPGGHYASIWRKGRCILVSPKLYKRKAKLKCTLNRFFHSIRTTETQISDITRTEAPTHRTE